MFKFICLVVEESKNKMNKKYDDYVVTWYMKEKKEEINDRK
jgi:hypothetical protein